MITLALTMIVTTATCPLVALSGSLGADLGRESAGNGTTASLAVGAIAGADLAPCVDLPLYSEVGVRFGPPRGADDGVRAVRVSSWDADLHLAGGVLLPLTGDSNAGLLALLLAGPDLRLTRTSVDIYGSSTSSTGYEAFAALTAGLVLAWGRLRVSPRLFLSLPDWHPALLLTVGGQLSST